MRIRWTLAIFGATAAGVLGAACLQDVTDYCFVGVDCPGDGGASAAGAGGVGGAGGAGGAMGPCIGQPTPVQGCTVATCACPHTSIPIEPEALPHCFGLLATERWSEPDGAEKAEALTITQNDDIVIAGRYNGAFDLGVGSAPNAGMGADELWVARVSSDLTPLWQIGTSTQSPDAGFEPGGSGAKAHLTTAFDRTMSSETIVLFTSVEGEHDLNGTLISAPLNTRDCVLLRLTADGTLLNALNLRPGIGNVCDANGIASTQDALYVVGEFNGTLNPVPTSAADGCMEMATNGDDDGFVIKLDHALNPQWCRHFSGGAEDDAYAVAAGPDGGAVVVGDFSGNLQVGETSLNADAQDAVVLYYEPDGGVRWATSWGDVSGQSREQRGSTVTVTDDAIFVGGSHEGDVLIDGTSYEGQNGQLDMAVVRLDLDGRIEWHRVFNGADDDDMFRMTTDALNVYVAGTVRGLIDLHQDPPINQPAGSSDDAFLLSLDRSCGHTIAARRFAGNKDQIARGLGLLSDGTIVMSLTYEDDTQWSDNQPLINTTGNDDIALGLFLP